MPIRFFCEHCRQMLKIGTSKMGSVVQCPRCSKSVVVPPQSSPQAELLYQMLKNRGAAETSAFQSDRKPPLPESEPDTPVSGWGESDWNDPEWDANLNRWLDELRSIFPAKQQASGPANPTPTSSPSDSDTIALLALQKRYQFMVTSLYLLSVVAFCIGIVVGFFVYALFQPPRSHQPLPGSVSINEVTGTIFYRNQNGDRLADADAVIICLPKDRLPSTLFTGQGLRPGDVLNHDTVQQIHELGGMYARADANGAFTLQYREGRRYVVLLISANQKRTEGVLLPGMLQELRKYFRDPELFQEYALHVDEYEWSGGKNSLRYTFE